MAVTVRTGQIIRGITYVELSTKSRIEYTGAPTLFFTRNTSGNHEYCDVQVSTLYGIARLLTYLPQIPARYQLALLLARAVRQCIKLHNPKYAP